MLIDRRAGSENLMRYEPVKTRGQLCTLDSGDVCILGNGPDNEPYLVGVEMKSIWDMVSSMNTGRLQGTQIPAMLDYYRIPWLLIYGPYKPGPQGELLIPARGGRPRVKETNSGIKLRTTQQTIKGGGITWRPLVLGRRPVPYGYLENFLFDVAAVGFNIKHVYDEREAAVWLGWLENWWSKPWSKHRGMRALDRSRELSLMPEMDEDTHQRARIAAQLPGVGYERAVAAARYFTSVRAMINADAGEWEKVDGIGRVIARTVERTVK